MFRSVGRFVVALMTLPATACSPLVVLNATVPNGTYTRTTDIAYGIENPQKLDVYRPLKSAAAAPVIMFLYGGSWKNGERDQYRFVGEAFARRGYVTVLPDYRKYPDVVFPEFVHDAAAALKWVRQNIAAHGGDANKIFLMGHSAGAHIAALVLLDPTYLKRVGLDAASVRGMVGLAGPYAFDPVKLRSTRPVFEHLTNHDVARPVTFAKKGAPPFLLLHGSTDGTVLPLNMREMAAALEKAGGRVEQELIPDTGHIGILLALSRTFENLAPVHDRIDRFINGKAPSR